MTHTKSTVFSFKSSLIISFLFFNFISPLFSQPRPNAKRPEGRATIKGVILDDDTKNPVSAVKIALHSSKDSSVLGGTFSKSKGEFELKAVPAGKYYLSLLLVSYENKLIDLKQISGDETINLGTISLKVNSSSTNDVVVTAQRETMQFDADKKIINVDKNLMATGGSAIDVLQNTPSVSVDFDGNVSLRGSSSVNILINGQPQVTSATSRVALLEQISASDIDKIEIINSPGAKYSPEGVGGIINIVLKKRQNLGFNGLFGLSAGTHDKYNSNINLNYGMEGINFFLSDDVRQDHRWSYVNTDRTSFIKDTTAYLYQRANSERDNLHNSLRTGFDLFLGKNDIATLAFNSHYSDPKRFKDLYSDDENSQKITKLYQRTYNPEIGPDKSNSLSLNYVKKFEEKDRQINIDMSYSNSISTNSSDRYIYQGDSNRIILPLDSTNPAISRIYTENHSKNFNFSANYAHPFEDKSKLEVGVNTNIRKTDNLYDYQNYTSQEGFQSDNTKRDSFQYQEHIYALYSTFNDHYGDFTYKLGARLENAVIRTQQDKINSLNPYTANPVNEYNYISLFPSMNLNYNFDETNSLHLNYTRRINRPNIGDLNPFVDISNPRMLQFGNPFLRPEYINNFDLTYSKTTDTRTILSSLFYRHYADVIRRYSLIDSLGIQHSSSINLNDATFFGAEFIDDEVLYTWWKMNATLSLYRNLIKGYPEYNINGNNNYSFTFKTNSTITIDEGFSMQLFLNYTSPQITPQGTIRPLYNLDIAFRKDIFNDKGNLTLRFSDVFNTSTFAIQSSNFNEQTQIGFNSFTDRKRETRVVMLSFTYKLNNVQKKQREKTRDRDNQDNPNPEQEREN